MLILLYKNLKGINILKIGELPFQDFKRDIFQSISADIVRLMNQYQHWGSNNIDICTPQIIINYHQDNWTIKYEDLDDGDLVNYKIITVNANRATVLELVFTLRNMGVRIYDVFEEDVI